MYFNERIYICNVPYVHTYVFTEYCTVYTLSELLKNLKFVCMYSLQFFFSPELNPDYRRSIVKIYNFFLIWLYVLKKKLNFFFQFLWIIV